MMSQLRNRLVLTVKEIHEGCPIYKVGDRMVIDEPGISTPDNPNMCLPFLGDLMPFFRALTRGVAPEELGLPPVRDNKTYLQCHDPGRAYGGGGWCLFEVALVPVEDLSFDLGIKAVLDTLSGLGLSYERTRAGYMVRRTK